MNTSNSLFEVKKTVRFELKPYIKTREYLKWNNDYNALNSYISHIKEEEFEKWFDWNEFCKSQYHGFLKRTKHISKFLGEVNNELNKEDSDKTKKSIQFNFKWFKWVFKNIPSLKNIQDFTKLRKKLEEITESYKSSIVFFDFEKDNGDKQSNQKQSDVSKELRKLAYLNRNFLTIFKYLWSNNEKETDKEILERYAKVKNILWEDFGKLNNSIITSHQNETSGACIGRYTLNTYSMFRRETDLLKNNSDDFKNNLWTTVDTIIKYWIDDDKGNKIQLKITDITEIKLESDFSDDFKNHIEKLELQFKLENFDFNRSLDEVIEELDLINAQLLNAYITCFRQEYEKTWEGLFDIEFKIDDEWNRKLLNVYNDKSKAPKIRKLWYFSSSKGEYIRLNQWQTLEWYEHLDLLDLEQKDLTEEEKYQKKLANKFLQIIFKQDFINRDYNNIKQFRDKLAKYRWKLRQDIKNSEREFINEGMIRYFWNILEKDWNYFLALTEKVDIDWEAKIKNIEDVKIENFSNNSGEWDFKIYKYHQLSFSAIEKLCLLKDWDYANNEQLIKDWDKYKYQKKDLIEKCDLFKNNKNEHWRKTKWKCSDCDRLTNEKKQQFLKNFQDQIIKILETLKNDNKYSWYDFSSFLPEIKKLDSVEKIIEFIEHHFYKLEEKHISEEKLFELADNKNILLFQIYNKDFNIYKEKFLSDEEKLEEKEHWEETKLLKITKRKKEAKPNLFTLYWKDIFKNESFLWQEWGIFFRKADPEKEEKRFRNNKFLVSFDVRFYKWKTIWNARVCDKKEDKIKKQIDFLEKNLLSLIKKEWLEKFTFLWIDRWEKEHLTWWLYDHNLDYLWTIWNTNFVKKVGKENKSFKVLQKPELTYLPSSSEKNIYKQIELNHCYFNKEWQEEKDTYLNIIWLQKYHIKKIFQKDENWIFYSDLRNWWKIKLKKQWYWFEIVDKDWNPIILRDSSDNKEVIDYYLLFEAERYKRILDINSELKYSINMWKLKKWYIAIIKDFLKQKIEEFEKQWKHLIIVFENQSSKKWNEITNKFKWASILEEAEKDLVNSFSYLKFKGNAKISWIQLWMNLKKEDLVTKDSEYTLYNHILFIDPKNTSQACPVCNSNFIKEIRKWKVKENESINKLCWHWKWEEAEASMHHINDASDQNYAKWKWKSWSLEDGSICDYNMKHNPKWFDFIQSWDDLATYNIAKKAKEYLGFLAQWEN